MPPTPTPTQVYIFSGGKLKPVANPQYTNIKNGYEITFDLQSTIQVCAYL